MSAGPIGLQCIASGKYLLVWSYPLRQAVVDAVEWIVMQEGVDFAIHYLDDYLVVGAPASPECAEALTTLLGVFDRLGLPVAMD